MVRYYEIIKEADYFDIVGKKRKELITQNSWTTRKQSAHDGVTSKSDVK